MSGFHHVPCIVCKFMCRPIGMIAICEKCAILPVEKQSQRFVEVAGSIVDTHANPPRVVGPARGLGAATNTPAERDRAARPHVATATQPPGPPAPPPPAMASAAAEPERSKFEETLTDLLAKLKQSAQTAVTLGKLERACLNSSAEPLTKAMREAYSRNGFQRDETIATLAGATVAFSRLVGLSKDRLLAMIGKLHDESTMHPLAFYEASAS